MKMMKMMTMMMLILVFLWLKTVPATVPMILIRWILKKGRKLNSGTKNFLELQLKTWILVNR